MRKHTYRVVMEAYTDSIGGAASHLRKHEKAHLAGRDGSLHRQYRWCCVSLEKA